MMNPRISVLVITYNHSKYIEACVNSVLAQSIEEEYEIVICDDDSNDDTGRIIQNKYATEPRIRYIKRENNVGPNKNVLYGIKECRGEYIAPIEGDDYWIDETKLQKQYEVLLSRNNAVLCITDCIVVSECDEVLAESYIYEKYRNNNSIRPVDMYEYAVPGRTAMFKADAIKNPPEELYDIPYLDMMIFPVIAQKGDVVYLDYPSAAYRLHSAGMYMGSLNFEKSSNMLRSFEIMYEYFSGNESRSLLFRLKIIFAKKCIKEAIVEHRYKWILARCVSWSLGILRGDFFCFFVIYSICRDCVLSLARVTATKDIL